MPRILLLLPTSTYRAPDFLSAAKRLGVQIVAASERPNVMQARYPDSLLTLNFHDAKQSAADVREFHREHPLDAVIGVDDQTAVVAAAIGSVLGLKHNSVESAQIAQNKFSFAQTLSRHGLPVPAFTLGSLGEDPAAVAERVHFPCVLKPLFLSGSRGVIRADNPAGFTAAWKRIAAILALTEVRLQGGDLASLILVQDFVQGFEVAVEGLLTDGRLRVLALFDKPDPLNGPFFEETLYVTPSRHQESDQKAMIDCVERACRAIGLREGPVHAELRFNDQGPWLIELAARSIGGLCSRVLRFGAGLSLEDLIVRNALGMQFIPPARESAAAGVMMIPMPGAGILDAVHGIEAAKEIPEIEEVAITATLGKQLVPLPEGSSYLGFIFARGGTPQSVERALREAHCRLEFILDGRFATVTATARTAIGAYHVDRH
jgi:biotin carboxylase